MTPQQMIGLAVRLFSVWMLFLTLQFIGSGVAINSQPGIQPSYAYFYASVVMFCLAVALWVFPMSIAHRLLPRTKYDNVLRVPVNDAVTIACVVIGLWLFSSEVLPDVAHFISLAVAMKAQGQPVSASDDFTLARLGPALIELFVVWILCFKAHAVSRFFTTERTLPTEE